MEKRRINIERGFTHGGGFHADDVFSANTPTAVTLPSRTEIKDLWKGKTTKSYDTSAPV